ncbi:MAG TPA: 3-deoxy-8-phosphooctulonate synthase [Thermoanaerobaculia bacterium]|nr:3-deoxy-8-phosphooctulonate synthase [Thermoanaerobaculia bacterium]
MTVRPVELAPGVVVGGDALPFVAGPCVIEDAETTLATARQLAAMAHRLGLPLVFKASFDKANRSSPRSFRGPGMSEGLRVLAEVRRETGLPILTDVHAPEQCEPVAEVCHVLQIPAFLCRQSDLIAAAARTGRALNVKKGQFMAPEDMRWVVAKAAAAGGSRVVVTERGVGFGYHNLVVDMRSFPILHELGIPVLFDATHSLQLPGAGDGVAGGDRRFAEPLARAAVAAGADGVFMEVHPDPDRALSDAATQLPLAQAEALAVSLIEIRRTLRAAVPLA